VKLLFAVERLGAEGGMERFLEIVLPGLLNRGATVHVVARKIDAAPAGVSAETVSWSDEHDAPNVAAASVVLDVCRRFAPDVAFAHNVMDAGIVEALRTASWLTYHLCDHRPFCPNGDRVFPRSGGNCVAAMGSACVVHALTDGCAYGPRPRTLELIRRRSRLRDAIARADTVVVGSSYMRARAAANGIAPARILVLEDPLTDDAFAAPPVRAGGTRVVLFAGRLVPQKGLRSLVRALATIVPARRPHLDAYGDGPEAVAVAADAAKLGVGIDLHGTVGADELRFAIDDAALVAVPSLWAEPFGRVGIEAFARGRPVVAYDVGGVRAWLSDGANGIVVPAADERALGSTIERLLDDPRWRAQLGKRARADADRYRLEAYLDALLAAVGGRRHGERFAPA
jgi:glycosyltransferase involved in cell wall biosynthesis